ncbi:hypothetical protein ONZ43_g6392 [Nemania bipapillata]|uniref:Uncharacterized protein n=1 Tax=Nemania bipapillata TaxID=110536 RepID=A0ACC2I0A5_9PEZI|nr:hypothetical protein ONZ43_g6392 [Nemania bipapillata]
MASTSTLFKTNLSQEAIPESPRQDTPAVKPSPKKEFKSPPLMPNANPDKATDEEEPHIKMLSSDPTGSSAARLGGTVLNGGIGDALNGTPSTTTRAKVPSATKSVSKTVAPVSTAKTATKTLKSPMTAKAPSNKEPSKATSSSTTTKKVAGTKTAAPKPAPIDLPSSSAGFVKPKPKSPTRPVKLPSSLTTHTASSAQKLGNGNTAPATRQSLSRASGNLQHLSVNPTTHRSPSRNSVSTIGATTTKTLKHKPSNANVGRSRPSLGPPPKPAAKDQIPAKRESQVDETFLARMMRPTESSAKKTAEKVPVTPPRKKSVPIKKPDSKEAEKVVKKVVAKIPASSTQAKTAKPSIKPAAVKEQPAAKETTPPAPQVETVDPVIEEAKPPVDVAEVAPVNDEKVEGEPIVEDTTQEEPTESKIETMENVETPADVDVTTDISPAEEPEAVEVVSEALATTEVDVVEPATSIPVVSADPLKVEDIEEVVEEVQEPNHEPAPAEPTADGSHPDESAETGEAIAASVEASDANIEETADDLVKQEEAASKEAETETEDAVTSTHSPVGISQDLIEEAIIRDATAAAL